MKSVSVAKEKIKKGRNIVIYFLSFFASAIGILLNFVLARFLEAEQFGRLQYLVAMATTISQLLILGLNSFLIREAKTESQKNSVFSKCISLYFVVVLFSTPILFFLLKNTLLSQFANLSVVILVLAMSILMGLNSLITSYFQGNGKLHLTILFENLLPKLVLLLIVIVFIVIGAINSLQDVYLILYVVLYSIVAIPFCIFLFKGSNFNFSKSEIKSILFFFGVTVTYSLGNNLTKVLQGSFYKNDVVLGIISVSLSIVGLVKIFTSVLDNLVKPIFSKKKRENDNLGLLEVYRFDTRMNSYISVPLYLFFILHPQRFLSIFGQSYVEYPMILVLIAIASAISDLTGPNGSLLAMTGKEMWELVNGFIFFTFYIASVFIFSFDHIYGLSISLLIGQIAVNIAKYVEVWLIYKTTPLNPKTLLSIIIIVIVNLLIILPLKLIHLPVWLWLAIGIAVGIVCVALNCFVITLYRKTDFKMLLNIRL